MVIDERTVSTTPSTITAITVATTTASSTAPSTVVTTMPNVATTSTTTVASTTATTVATTTRSTIPCATATGTADLAPSADDAGDDRSECERDEDRATGTTTGQRGKGADEREGDDHGTPWAALVSSRGHKAKADKSDGNDGHDD